MFSKLPMALYKRLLWNKMTMGDIRVIHKLQSFPSDILNICQISTSSLTFIAFNWHCSSRVHKVNWVLTWIHILDCLNYKWRENIFWGITVLNETVVFEKNHWSSQKELSHQLWTIISLNRILYPKDRVRLVISLARMILFLLGS